MTFTQDQKNFAAQELCRQRGQSPYDWVNENGDERKFIERWRLALVEVEDRLDMDQALLVGCEFGM